MKKINQITFCFAEEGPGRGSEDIKTECDVNCFDFFKCFFDGRQGWKNHIQLKRTCTRTEKEETRTHRQRVRSVLSRGRTLELRQCSVQLDKGRKSESS